MFTQRYVPCILEILMKKDRCLKFCTFSNKLNLDFYIFSDTVCLKVNRLQIYQSLGHFFSLMSNVLSVLAGKELEILSSIGSILNDNSRGFLGRTHGEEPACQCRRYERCSSIDPWVRKIPWWRAWQVTLVFLPGESHGQRSLAGYCP